MFFEDIDQVFNDESEFHPQLLKLISVTKVPVILTMSENPEVKAQVEAALSDAEVSFEKVKYKYLKPKTDELRIALSIIKVFESEIGQLFATDRNREVHINEVVSGIIEKKERIKASIDTIKCQQQNCCSMLNDL